MGSEEHRLQWAVSTFLLDSVICCQRPGYFGWLYHTIATCPSTSCFFSLFVCFFDIFMFCIYSVFKKHHPIELLLVGFDTSFQPPGWFYALVCVIQILHTASQCPATLIKLLDRSKHTAKAFLVFQHWPGIASICLSPGSRCTWLWKTIRWSQMSFLLVFFYYGEWAAYFLES